MSDWDTAPVIIRGGGAARRAPALMTQRLGGTATATGVRVQNSDDAGARTADRATDVVKRKVLSLDARQLLIGGRALMKLTQVELNQRCAFAPNTIREVEAGRLTPTQGQLNILNRVLKVVAKLS